MSSSGKIKAKDLSYDKTLPPFLQRLKAQNSGHGDADRHQNPIARPKRAKQDDEEDGPTVVDESGECLSKDDVKKLTDPVAAGEGDENVKGTLQSDEPKASGALPATDGENNASSRRTEQKMIDGTTQKKRKAAKVVGGDEDADEADLPSPKKQTKNENGPAKVVKKVKKKVKVNLSFDDDGSVG